MDATLEKPTVTRSHSSGIASINPESSCRTELMTETIKDRIWQSTAFFYRDQLGLSQWQQLTEGRVGRQYETHMFEQLVRVVGSVCGKRLLDLGCGWGGVVLHAASQGANAFGIEPEKDRVTIAQELIKEAGSDSAEVRQGVGEELPYPSTTFDIVTSYQVLEHVRDPATVIAEVARVLKPGGLFHFATPNYMSFWEPHYKIFWLPLMPKWLGRVYLRLRGRNPDFLGHLKYVNPLSVRRLLRQQKFTFVDLRQQRA